MLMAADRGEGGVSDLLMSAKKSNVNMAKIRLCTKKCLKIYFYITVCFFITSVFLTSLNKYIHKMAKRLQLLSAERGSCTKYKILMRLIN